MISRAESSKTLLTCLAPSALLPRRLTDDLAAFQVFRLVRCLEAVVLVSLKAQLSHLPQQVKYLNYSKSYNRHNQSPRQSCMAQKCF